MSSGEQSLNSSDGSISGADQPKVEGVLSARDLGKCFGLDDSVVQCLEKRPYDPEDPVVILQYLDLFYHFPDQAQKKQAIIQAMTDNTHGERGEQVNGSDCVFAFKTLTHMEHTRTAMQNDANLSPIFHLPGFAINMMNQMNQLLPADQRQNLRAFQKKIKTTVLMSYETSGTFEVADGYEFFCFNQ